MANIIYHIFVYLILLPLINSQRAERHERRIMPACWTDSFILRKNFDMDFCL